MYRLLVATESEPMAVTLRQLRQHELCGRVAQDALSIWGSCSPPDPKPWVRRWRAAPSSSSAIRLP